VFDIYCDGTYLGWEPGKDAKHALVSYMTRDCGNGTSAETMQERSRLLDRAEWRTSWSGLAAEITRSHYVYTAYPRP
jgi:hypothetical protein